MLDNTLADTTGIERLQAGEHVDPVTEHVQVGEAQKEAQEADKRSKKLPSKKQVRVLLDARTELTERELKEAREGYLIEQARLRREMEEQKYRKGTVELAQELLRAPPAISE